MAKHTEKKLFYTLMFFCYLKSNFIKQFTKLPNNMLTTKKIYKIQVSY